MVQYHKTAKTEFTVYASSSIAHKPYWIM